MPQKYYSTSTTYPDQQLALLEAIRYYICTTLYPDETYTQSKLRFLLTDITPTMALRESVKKFNLTNAKFPFTAYTIGELTENDNTFNMYAVSKKYFSSVFNTKFYTRPLTQEIPMISFFSNSFDYDRARKILHEQNSAKTQIDVPIEINGELTSFPILISFEISKGNYAHEFEEQLRVGNISDVVHNLSINFHDIIIDSSDVHAIDDIEVALKVLETYKTDSIITINNVLVPDSPEISSTNPVDGATDIDVDFSIIINFSTPMNEQSVEENLDITPGITTELLWSSDSTQLVINPWNDLQNDTEYTVEIDKYAKSGIDIYLEDVYSFSFTTEI